MPSPDTVFLVLCVTWVASEIVIGRRRAADRGQAHDRGSLRLLHVSIYAAIGGKTVYRVRMGPYGTASELATAKSKLADGGLPALAIKAN